MSMYWHGPFKNKQFKMLASLDCFTFKHTFSFYMKQPRLAILFWTIQNLMFNQIQMHSTIQIPNALGIWAPTLFKKRVLKCWLIFLQVLNNVEQYLIEEEIRMIKLDQHCKCLTQFLVSYSNLSVLFKSKCLIQL